ncbi:MAG: hypothetical protein KJ065_26440 [Anaerolineae bacterium]|nr:hypothetical protein [Anaerolineae bacterium]
MAQDTMSDEMKHALDVQQRYENYLLSKPHVVGVGVGFAYVKGEETTEIAVIVMVEHKVPMQELEPSERIPSRLEGVRIDVREMGQFTAFGDTSVQ